MRVKPSVDILKYYSFVSRLHSYNQYVRNGRIYRSMRKGIIQNVEKMKLEKNKSDGVLSSYHMKIFQQSEELKFHILAWEGDNLEKPEDYLLDEASERDVLEIKSRREWDYLLPLEELMN